MTTDRLDKETAMQIGPFVHDSTTATPYECACEACCEMYTAEHEAEMAAEARNEMALYGPTEAMVADYEAEADREAAMGIGYWIFRDEGRTEEEEEFYAWKDSLSA